MSKGYNMAGWRLGFCAGNAEMVRALATIKGYYDYGIFQPIQIAGIIAMRHGEELVERQALEYQKRRDVLVEGLRRIGWEVEPPKASMFVWARYPEEWRERMGSIDFAMKLLEEAEVAVSPGRGFGEAGEGYLRLALVENEHRLRQAVRQIAALPARGNGGVGGARKEDLPPMTVLTSWVPCFRGPSEPRWSFRGTLGRESMMSGTTCFRGPCSRWGQKGSPKAAKAWHPALPRAPGKETASPCRP